MAPSKSTPTSKPSFKDDVGHTSSTNNWGIECTSLSYSYGAFGTAGPYPPPCHALQEQTAPPPTCDGVLTMVKLSGSFSMSMDLRWKCSRREGSLRRFRRNRQRRRQLLQNTNSNEVNAPAMDRRIEEDTARGDRVEN